jgi:hypothetical protein
MQKGMHVCMYLCTYIHTNMVPVRTMCKSLQPTCVSTTHTPAACSVHIIIKCMGRVGWMNPRGEHKSVNTPERLNFLYLSSLTSVTVREALREARHRPAISGYLDLYTTRLTEELEDWDPNSTENSSRERRFPAHCTGKTRCLCI